MTTDFLQREPDAGDRERWRTEIAAPPAVPNEDGRLVLFVFRVGGERFGIEPAHMELAAPLPGVHSIPHRGQALAGVVNVRGTITLCFSLADILGSAQGPATERPMMLVLSHRGWRVACRVDAAEGVSGFAQSDLQPPPATLRPAGRSHVKGIFHSENEIAWLDASSLFEAFDAAAR